MSSSLLDPPARVDTDDDLGTHAETAAHVDIGTHVDTGTHVETDTDGPADVVAPSPRKYDAVADLADHLGQTVHALHRAKAQLMARGDGVADWSTRVVLARIVMTGPKRVSELADMTQSDASTVSRQVAAMVKDGLLERQADPGDGRASLLVATDRGREVMEVFKAGRNRELARLLHTWSPEDCTTFARLLERFTRDLVGGTAEGTDTTDGPAARAASKEH